MEGEGKERQAEHVEPPTQPFDHELFLLFFQRHHRDVSVQYAKLLTHETKARQGKARQGTARHGKTRQGKARQGKARRGKARQGKARQMDYVLS
jgi:hypothetical protein